MFRTVQIKLIMLIAYQSFIQDKNQSFYHLNISWSPGQVLYGYPGGGTGGGGKMALLTLDWSV